MQFQPPGAVVDRDAEVIEAAQARELGLDGGPQRLAAFERAIDEETGQEREQQERVEDAGGRTGSRRARQAVGGGESGGQEDGDARGGDQGFLHIYPAYASTDKRKTPSLGV